MAYGHLKRGMQAQKNLGALTFATMLMLTGWANAEDAGKTDIPSYYPSDYQRLIEAAKAEAGSLVIYSSYTQQAWDPVFRAFQKKYPFVKSVKNLDVEGEEVYQKLKMEASVGRPSVDIVEIQPSVGAKLRHEQELLMPYQSPELAQYPKDIIQPYPNGFQYAISALVIGYNAKILPQPVDSIEGLVKQLNSPEGSKLKIGVRNISSAFAFTTYYTLLNAKPELWGAFETILAQAKPEGSSGSLLTKLQTGEYAAAVFMSDATMLPAVNKSAGLLGVAIAKDGTPFQGGSISISTSAPHPNTAKLFVDFMLSQEGQQAILQGGRPAVRKGLNHVEGLYSFEEATSAIPETSVVVVPYTEVPAEKVAEFTKRWNSALK
jgi:iron(III) transport system substrate-binding protein